MRKVQAIEMPDGSTIHAEVSALDDEYDISMSEQKLSFNSVTEIVEKTALELHRALEKVKPDQTTVEFSVAMGIESGNLLAFLANASSKGTLKVALKWGSEKK